MHRSVKSEMPKGRMIKGERRFKDPETGRFTLKQSKRTLAKQKQLTKWAGADKTIVAKRPANIFAKPAPGTKPKLKPVKPKVVTPKPVKIQPAKPGLKPKVKPEKIKKLEVKEPKWTPEAQKKWSSIADYGSPNYDPDFGGAMHVWSRQGNELFREIDKNLAGGGWTKKEIKALYETLANKAHETYGLEIEPHELEAFYKAFQKHMKTAPRYDKGPVYRGMSAADSESSKQLAKLKPGFEFREGWTVSASVDEKVAVGFSKEAAVSEKAKKYVVEYHGKSVKISNIEEMLGGEFTWEQEHIITKGQRWRVKSVKKEKKEWMIDWDQMLSEGKEPERGVVSIIKVVVEEI